MTNPRTFHEIVELIQHLFVYIMNRHTEKDSLMLVNAPNFLWSFHPP